MNFIKKIFEGKIDEEVHNQFKRFSKGEFDKRALVDISVSKQVKVKTTFEFVNWLARKLVESLSENVKMSGGIITTQDITSDIKFEISGKKNYMGVKTFLFNTDVSKDDIISLMDKYPDAVFCLTFACDYGKIKTKVKSPKSGKPAKKTEEKPKADYCTFTTKDLNFAKEFVFDVGGFKKCFIEHVFVIEELVVPDEYKNDFKLARIHARRKGKLIRKMNVDGKEIVKEAKFEA